MEQAQNEGPIVITRNGKAVAVLIAPMNDDDLESLLLARSPRLQTILKQSRQRIEAGEGLTADVFWETVEKSSD